MNTLDLRSEQLKRAATIKEQIDNLSKELRRLLDGSADGAASIKKRTMSAAAERKIAVGSEGTLGQDPPSTRLAQTYHRTALMLRKALALAL